MKYFYCFNDKYCGLIKNYSVYKFLSGNGYRVLKFKESINEQNAINDLINNDGQEIHSNDYFAISNKKIKFIEYIESEILFDNFGICVTALKFRCSIENEKCIFFIYCISYNNDKYTYQNLVCQKEFNLSSNFKEHQESAQIYYLPKLNEFFVRYDKLESNHFMAEIIIPGFDISFMEKCKYVQYMKNINGNIITTESLSTTYLVEKL